MTEAELYPWLLWVMVGLAVVTFVALRFITAPYGRHTRGGWGPTIPNRVGWIVMESPSVFWFFAVFAYADNWSVAPLALLALWQMHYVQRTFVFPFRTRTSGKRMPALVVGIAFVFNLLNAYLNARWISHVGEYGPEWLTDPRFLIGVAVFLVGYVINIQSDTILINLRKPGETGYKIPRGGLFRWVSAPNYFGELVEWIGFAIAAWSPAGAAFALYTAANLVPRALDNHDWYRETFDDYPPERKAVIPKLL